MGLATLTRFSCNPTPNPPLGGSKRIHHPSLRLASIIHHPLLAVVLSGITFFLRICPSKPSSSTTHQKDESPGVGRADGVVCVMADRAVAQTHKEDMAGVAVDHADDENCNVICVLYRFPDFVRACYKLFFFVCTKNNFFPNPPLLVN